MIVKVCGHIFVMAPLVISLAVLMMVVMVVPATEVILMVKLILLVMISFDDYKPFVLQKSS